MASSGSVVAERLLGVAGVCTVLAVIAALDARVRTMIASTVATDPVILIADTAGRVHRLTLAAMETAGLQAVDHTTLVVFGIAGVALTILTLRM